MRELSPGLWHWQARHPDWKSSEPWDPNVSSYAIDDGERLLLFDPLGVPSEIEGRVARFQGMQTRTTGMDGMRLRIAGSVVDGGPRK